MTPNIQSTDTPTRQSRDPRPPIVELRDVTLSFKIGSFSQNIFHQVNLKIFEGDSIVIVGPSGHGKSLLLRLIGDLAAPTEGEILWQGRPITSYSVEEKIKWMRKIGMLFQRNALFDSMSVFQNVAFPLSETTSLSESEIARRVENYLYLVQLSDSKHQFPSEISGGMQKRLGIARALALEPNLVLYDDPTAGLDPITSRHIVQLMLSLKDKTKSTIVTVTNDMNRAFQLAGRIVFVAEGKVIETGDREETINHPDERVQQFIRGKVTGPLSQLA